jgi:AraC-like DNA-binding protein
MSFIRESIWPVSDWSITGDFDFGLSQAPLGCLTSMTESINPHRSHRTRRDVENSGDRGYLLFANQEAWQVAHNGHREYCHGGDCILVDSQGELETWAPSGFRGVILKLPTHWVQSWLPDPDLLAGRRIARDVAWGAVFSPMVSQLTPDLASAETLPHSVLVDQVGALLALIVGAAEKREMPVLLEKIRECIRQRCTESQLKATEVAASLNVHPQMLHRVLAVHNRTFASELLDARVGAAQQMLTSRSCNELSVAEIARQSGFQSPAYFGRVLRARTGKTASELRRRPDA